MELYRHFDISGRLLYVGIASNSRRRLSQHRNVSDAWADQVYRMTVEWHPTELEAADAERLAIATERPLYNRRSANLPGSDCPVCEERRRQTRERVRQMRLRRQGKK
jgi:excinuclease UvrABC nuclease subunit